MRPGKIFIAAIMFLCACNSNENLKHQPNGKLITDPVVQDSLYSNLKRLTTLAIAAGNQKDTLSFLLLPVKATCPACRKKTIDSIVKYKDRLDDRHFVVIAGNGMKTIGGFFREQNKEMPFSAKIFYDTIGGASNLTSTNPNVYYAVNGKVYRKVSCLPSTIKADLKEFFANL